MFRYENQAKQKGFWLIIGIDEAGRGPLAGPVVAAAVLLKKRKFEKRIADSKQMTSSERESAFFEIWDNACVGIGIMNENVIDQVNILQATYLAMAQAVNQLIHILPEAKFCDQQFAQQVCLLVDGPSFQSDLPYFCQPIIDGDNLSASIACASIVAKVTRDRILTIYDRIFPQYGFKDHKGYPTESHREAIKTHGVSNIHRRSFNLLGIDPV